MDDKIRAGNGRANPTSAPAEVAKAEPYAKPHATDELPAREDSHGHPLPLAGQPVPKSLRKAIKREVVRCKTSIESDKRWLKEHSSHTYGEDDFYLNTTATYHPCETPDGPPDYTSRSGSRYWYKDHGVIRHSDHWGGVASCEWWLKGGTKTTEAAGFCPWTGFRNVFESGYMRCVKRKEERIDALERLLTHGAVPASQAPEWAEAAERHYLAPVMVEDVKYYCKEDLDGLDPRKMWPLAGRLDRIRITIDFDEGVREYGWVHYHHRQVSGHPSARKSDGKIYAVSGRRLSSKNTRVVIEVLPPRCRKWREVSKEEAEKLGYSFA